MNTKLYTFITLVLFLFAGNVVASSTFTLSVATEDATQGTTTQAYYIGSTIQVWSYVIDGSSINWGPVSRTSNPSNSQDAHNAFRDFYPIPTDSIVRFQNSATGYITDFDEIYITSSLSNAFENHTAQFSNTENGFTTTCTQNYDSNTYRYYRCSVEDNYATSAGFLYYRPDDGTGNIYDLVYVTNKLMPTSACTDTDGDTYYTEGGYCGPIDCNDNNAAINPGATEICDGIDNDCNALIDENNICVATNYYCDADADSYYSSTVSGSCGTFNCVPATCQLTPGTDCDDTSDITYPGATEICDNADNNCNALIDENNICHEDVISTQWNPIFPVDADDLTCTIIVNNLYDPNNADVTVDYDITGSWTAAGQFTCTGGYCTQQINIGQQYTLKGTDMSCSAEFSYNGNTYASTSTVHIYEGATPQPPSSTNYDVEQRMRFADDSKEAGQTLDLYLNLNNNGDALKQAKVQVFLLGVTNTENRRYTVGPFDLMKGNKEVATLEIPIPEETPSGIYYARITIGDGNFRVVRHRVFFVK